MKLNDAIWELEKLKNCSFLSVEMKEAAKLACYLIAELNVSTQYLSHNESDFKDGMCAAVEYITTTKT